MNPQDEISAEISETPTLIMCGRCAHPNLEFRNHCRRCGTPLRSASNLIPGVEFFEWTATDGPQRKYRSTYANGPLLMLIAICVVMPFFLLENMSNTIRMLISIPILAAGILFWMLRRKQPSDIPEKPEDKSHLEEENSENRCKACGSEIESIDDICATCGAVVAKDLLSTQGA